MESRIGPSWRRRWSKTGSAYFEAKSRNKPVPHLFPRLDELMWDKLFARAQKMGARKRRLEKPEGKVLKMIRLRDIRMRVAAAARERAVRPEPKHDLERDLQASAAARAFVADRECAVRLYSALCNQDWIKDSESWSCSWRAAGRLVADLRQQGEYYLDFYLSGNEGVVAGDVEELLTSLGWTPAPDPEEAPLPPS